MLSVCRTVDEDAPCELRMAAQDTGYIEEPMDVDGKFNLFQLIMTHSCLPYRFLSRAHRFLTTCTDIIEKFSIS